MTRDVLLTLIGAVLGAFLGVGATVLFQEPLRRRVNRIRNWRIRRSERLKPQSALATHRQTFSFGPLQTSIYIIDGNGRSAFQMKNIEVRVSPKMASLPPELRSAKREVEERESKKKDRGEEYHWNGSSFAVEGIRLARTGLAEESEICLTLQHSDYYTFLAAQESLDRFIPKYDKTVREYYLEDFHWDNPIPFLSCSFGVNVALVTADDQLVVCRRSGLVGSRPLQFTVSANEGLSRGIDDQGGTHPPDLYACAYRALDEELGIERYEVERLEMLAFVIDLQLHQWGCLSWARLRDVKFSELADRYAGTVKDKLENVELQAIPFSSRAVSRYILDPARRNEWYGGAPATFYLALVRNEGPGSVHRAIKSAERYFHP